MTLYNKDRSDFTKAALAARFFPQYPAAYGWRKLMQLLADVDELQSLRQSRRRYVTAREYHLIISTLEE